MAPRVHFTRRTVFLGRGVSNPYAATPVVDGTPVTPAMDNNGVLFFRNAPLNANGILPGGAPATRFITSNPGAGVVASASLAASGGINPAKNVPVLLDFACGDTAATGRQIVVLRDGASGVGTVLWVAELGPNAANVSEHHSIVIPQGIAVAGSTNTAMTLEFTAAPAGTGFQSVTLWGYFGT